MKAEKSYRRCGRGSTRSAGSTASTKSTRAGRSGVAAMLLLAWLASSCFAQAQRSAPPGRLSGNFATEAERRDWESVIQSSERDRADRARAFVSAHPDSEYVPEAHYIAADRAFAESRFEEFVDHGEKALRGSGDWINQDDPQKIRRLQLLSQLAFFYAESGGAEVAAARANLLLAALRTGPPPANLSPEQWEVLRARFSSAAEYALGRALLGRFLAAKDKSAQVLDQAVRHLESAIRENPADDYAHYRLGAAQATARRMEESRRAYARAAALGGAASEPAKKRLEASFKKGGEATARSLIQEQREELKRLLAKRPRSILTMPGGTPHPILWWDGVPARIRESSLAPGPFSNIRFEDYAGPESCKPCHADKYEGWSKHAHRRMNAWAGPETVKGDFSGAAIEYRGGRASFSRNGDGYVMRLVRGGSKRAYEISRTIGSRFFQYYVGRQVEGPEARSHPIWNVEHVLPFGWWLDRAEWVPVVHIDEELPDDRRLDPFAGPSDVPYDYSCSACHTTRPLGDWMLRADGRLRMAQFSPREISLDLASYLRENHPELIQSKGGEPAWPEVRQVLDAEINELPAKSHAVTLGVSCEACHNGAKLHVAQSEEKVTRQPPLFFPSSPNVYIQTGESPDKVWARTPRNQNFICSRCHSGSRPRFAGGMDTWNSTEFSDAARGSCYQEDLQGKRPHLTCVTCHDPHFTIGKKWSRSGDLDDSKCLACHERFRPDESRVAHTRHPMGSEGARCMNCHMPRINEGMQDVVRTHRIFNPTEPKMIESNQPNACNLCHLDKPIDWTLGYLKQWYGATYSEEMLGRAYRRRDLAVGLGWLDSAHEPTRLVASAALTGAGAEWALPQLVDMLDDPYLVNRQFTQKGLEEMLAVQLADYGYRFYMFEKERRRPLERIREALLKPASAP